MKDSAELVARIARLARERGWTQEEFARRAGLNRHTARKILVRPEQAGRLHNATVAACAKALGMSVEELCGGQPDPYEAASQPELKAWLERHPQRLGPAEIDELYSLQGTGGPLTPEGIDHFVAQIERRRKIIEQVETIAGTEHVETLEKLVAELYEKVQLVSEASRQRPAAHASAKRR